MIAPPSPADPRATLSLEGDLTISRAAELKPRLLDALSGPLDVDLSGVTAIDGAGLQLLVMLSREAARRGVPIAWHAPSRAVRTALDRVRLHDPCGMSVPPVATAEATA
jgi:anti-sigma B factor antagonist